MRGTLVAEDPDLFAYRGPAPTDESKRDAFKVYEHLRDSEWCVHHRRYIRRLWKRFHALGLNDPSFATHFPFECPARIWEMRLTCIFNSWDWRLVPSQKPGAGPDFGIHMSNPTGRTMWVEATAPSAGTGSNRTGFVDAGQGHRMAYGKELQRTQSLRILQALKDKTEQHARWLKAGLVTPDDGLVIAISGSQWEGADLNDGGGPPTIVRCLFGIGEPTIPVPVLGTPGKPRSGPWTPGQIVRKHAPTGTVEIAAGAFPNGTCPQVSAVIFCANHIKNRPRRTGGDLVLVHNPTARVAFPFDAMRNGQEWYTGLRLRKHR